MINFLDKLKQVHGLKTSLELLLILLLFLAIRAYMQRDLISGPVPKVETTLLDGRKINLAAVHEKPVLLHFWASWCSICKLSQENIARLNRDYRVITVAMESGPKSEVAAYLKSNGLDFPVIVDQSGDLAEKFGVNAVPTSFVLAPDGLIRFTESGYTTTLGLKLRLWLASD